MNWKKFRQPLFQKLFQAVGISEIGGQIGMSLPVLGAELATQASQLRFVPGEENDFSALIREMDGDRPTDSLAAAAHQSPPAFQ